MTSRNPLNSDAILQFLRLADVLGVKIRAAVDDRIASMRADVLRTRIP